MSLETALAENTAALTAQTKTINSLLECWNTLRTQSIKLSREGHTAATITAAGVPLTDVPEVAAPAAETTKAPGKTAKAKADPKPAPTPDAPDAPEAAQTADATDSTASDSPFEEATEVSLEAVSDAITKYVPTHRAEVVAALAKFGAKRGSEIKPEERGLFLAEIAAKVGAE